MARLGRQTQDVAREPGGDVLEGLVGERVAHEVEPFDERAHDLEAEFRVAGEE